jgi:hypothetical protein
MQVVTNTEAGIESSTLADVPRKVWACKETHALVDLGFPNAEKWELIDGELIDKMGKNRPHVIWQGIIYE